MDPTIADIASAFAGHDFDTAIPHMADEVTWILVGETQITGKDAVTAVCEATTAELRSTTTEFTHFRTVLGDGCVVVDSTAEYIDHDGQRSLVSSCDLLDFRDGMITRIRSYNIELTP
ncbi:nuclear transport factor 2 family protein [Kocuria nitroreducens]|uniref:nuclear transport factor 2 family protein n=1 Tax=Kocuria nitroreducens TaxID=3058914 RepID=UPI0036DEE9E9